MNSNVFGGSEDEGQKGRKTTDYNHSDIFHLESGHQHVESKIGKKSYQKKDNDIFGIRERTTGEVRLLLNSLVE